MARMYLQKLREQRNETQQDVANALGISRQYYAMIEDGSRQKRMDILLVSRIADHFDMAVSDVIALEKEMNAEKKEDSA